MWWPGCFQGLLTEIISPLDWTESFALLTYLFPPHAIQSANSYLCMKKPRSWMLPAKSTTIYLYEQDVIHLSLRMKYSFARGLHWTCKYLTNFLGACQPSASSHLLCLMWVFSCFCSLPCIGRYSYFFFLCVRNNLSSNIAWMCVWGGGGEGDSDKNLDKAIYGSINVSPEQIFC